MKIAYFAFSRGYMLKLGFSLIFEFYMICRVFFTMESPQNNRYMLSYREINSPIGVIIQLFACIITLTISPQRRKIISLFLSYLLQISIILIIAYMISFIQLFVLIKFLTYKIFLMNINLHNFIFTI